ncbi:MAG: acetylxylan esterase [Rhodoferax sp.]|nr:acetylxylan esterase [Rhodoferax sp.]
MPLIDMPVAELHQYTGRNPRPDDFDLYWADALRDLDAKPPQAELVQSNGVVTVS